MRPKDIGVTVISLAVFGAFAYMMFRKLATQGAFNPANPDNLAYKATNAIGTSITGDPNFTFGGWIWDVTHPVTNQQIADLSKPVQLVPVEDAAGNVYYVSPDEAKAINEAYARAARAAGGPGATPGSDLETFPYGVGL